MLIGDKSEYYDHPDMEFRTFLTDPDNASNIAPFALPVEDFSTKAGEAAELLANEHYVWFEHGRYAIFWDTASEYPNFPVGLVKISKASWRHLIDDRIEGCSSISVPNSLLCYVDNMRRSMGLLCLRSVTGNSTTGKAGAGSARVAARGTELIELLNWNVDKNGKGIWRSMVRLLLKEREEALRKEREEALRKEDEQRSSETKNANGEVGQLRGGTEPSSDALTEQPADQKAKEEMQRLLKSSSLKDALSAIHLEDATAYIVATSRDPDRGGIIAVLQEIKPDSLIEMGKIFPLSHPEALEKSDRVMLISHDGATITDSKLQKWFHRRLLIAGAAEIERFNNFKKNYYKYKEKHQIHGSIESEFSCNPIDLHWPLDNKGSRRWSAALMAFNHNVEAIIAISQDGGVHLWRENEFYTAVCQFDSIGQVKGIILQRNDGQQAAKVDPASE